MSRQKSPLVAQRNEALVQRIQELKAEHPFWGYRRIWAYLHFVERHPVNKTRILRLMREHRLLVQPNLRLKAKRTPTGRKPKPTTPNEWWGIAMSQVSVDGFGWVYIVLVLDRYMKRIVGYDAGRPCTASHWLTALDMAVNRQVPAGVRDQSLSLMSDNGCQPTALAFGKACRILGLQQVFTSDTPPKGNAETERVLRTRKAECLWLQEWTGPFELIRALEVWSTDDNAHYLHSALRSQSASQMNITIISAMGLRSRPLVRGGALHSAIVL